MRPLLSTLFVLSLACSACSPDIQFVGSDAGVGDTGAPMGDVGPELADVPSIVVADAGPVRTDAGSDAGVVVMPDAGSDAGSDAGRDAPVAAHCGRIGEACCIPAMCDPGATCRVTMIGGPAMCAAVATECGGFGHACCDPRSGPQCGDSLLCGGTTCECGGPGQPCCSHGEIGPARACEDSSSCRPTGRCA